MQKNDIKMLQSGFSTFSRIHQIFINNDKESDGIFNNPQKNTDNEFI